VKCNGLVQVQFDKSSIEFLHQAHTTLPFSPSFILPFCWSEMGNCLRLLTRADVSDSDADDATLLDPGRSEATEIESQDTINTNHQINVTESSSDTNDESPLFFRMLSRSRRSRRSNNNSSSSSSVRNRGGGGRVRGSRHNRQSSATTSTHQHHGHNNGIAVSGRDQYISRTEQNQILLAQRLGLIQHLPLVQWESKKKPTVLSSPGPKNQDENTSTQCQQLQQQPASAASASSGDHREIIQSSTSINNNSPPGYEKTELYLPLESAGEAAESEQPKNESNNRGASDSSESNDQECTICMEEFENGENIRYLPCMHYYHQTCIDNWLMRSFTCPRCMESVDVAIMNSFAQQLS